MARRKRDPESRPWSETESEINPPPKPQKKKQKPNPKVRKVPSLPPDRRHVQDINPSVNAKRYDVDVLSTGHAAGRSLPVGPYWQVMQAIVERNEYDRMDIDQSAWDRTRLAAEEAAKFAQRTRQPSPPARQSDQKGKERPIWAPELIRKRPPEEPASEPESLRCKSCVLKKKGCDRQRPCQRYKDHGLGFEDCISEESKAARRTLDHKPGAKPKNGKIDPETGKWPKQTGRPMRGKSDKFKEKEKEQPPAPEFPSFTISYLQEKTKSDYTQGKTTMAFFDDQQRILDAAESWPRLDDEPETPAV